MIHSMTAFSRYEIKHSYGTAIWELRSVNQRYLDIYMRLPDQFRFLDSIIRERIRSKLKRGKIECSLYFDINLNTKNTLIFNKKLAQQLVKTAQWIKNFSNGGPIDPLAILRWPGVMTIVEHDLDTISTTLLTGMDSALITLIQVRQTEGKVLQSLIEQRLASITHEILKIRQYIPNVRIYLREKLLNKFHEIKLPLDPHRLEQELVILAQRIDIEEELDRLDLHVQETYNILNNTDIVGRRLDFMMQELNREANTLSSKSNNFNITKSAIELKVLIEQMREQIQNIE